VGFEEWLDRYEVGYEGSVLDRRKSEAPIMPQRRATPANNAYSEGRANGEQFMGESQG